MTDHATITGKIAAVIDATTLVLNIGQQHGVREGMLFAIVAAHQQIADPDSGEDLGHWEIVKARVMVTHVQQRMCTAQPPLSPDVSTSGTLSEMMVRHSFGRYGERSELGERERLEVVQGDIVGRPRTSPIAVGDAVRLVPHNTMDPPAEAHLDSGGDPPSQAYAGQAARSAEETSEDGSKDDVA
ncbi:MAG: hypothetical protein HOM68_19440 [Gemmatimonadetes bacterium]|nr:hypothetical protein [Gemmatimonadota bacterium]MBT5058725.1 hypothetical protein [Gemmatimonadota bacterium]MBT5144254.1 hypothetical protein [Gemmatimonadota bacterium]MBT5588720.1 hypothetical protein [Gemmatimonadota bacterium]MBT5964562.1 hypothetical protein [Gemmatimonadota bacterium]